VLPGTIVRTGCVSLPGPAYRPSAGVAVRHVVGRWGHLAGATCRQVGRASNARRVGVIDRDGLDASRAVATLIGRPVSTADNKLAGAIARTNRVPLPGHRYCSAARVTGRHAVGV